MKKKMNPQTKRAVVVLSIIALLILIAGIGSCSMKLRQSDNRPAVTDESDHPSAVPNDETVTLPKDRESSNESDTPSDSSNSDEKSEDGKIRDGQDNNSTSNPTKPSITPKPVTPTPKPADPSVPVKPVQPTPTPTVPVKPTEPTKPVKPTEPVKPTKPDRSDDDSGSGGGHVSYPAAVVEIITPAYSHAGTEFEVKTTLRNVKSLEWTVAQDGGDAKESDFLKGDLDKNGGKITITKPGSYIFTAAARNYGGSTYTFTKTLTIYPVYEIIVTTEPYANTDQAFTVKTTLSDNIKQQLNWHIYKDGNEVSWADTVTGTLTNSGGSIQLKEKGKYTLKATAYDETSREFSGKADIEVLPVVELSLQVPKTAHTDTPAIITAETKELGELSVVWSVTKNGQAATLSDCAEGTLDNEGGSIRFPEKGLYTLTAAVTDKSGRVFSASEEIKVYPVAAFSFTLPETAHTDKAVTVSVTSSELQDMKAEWTILHNGKSVPLADVLEGTFTNEGGSVRFVDKGSYLLKATLTDETGRSYTYEDGIVVYPVAETGFYLPEKTHTDTTVEVKTTFKEADGLSAIWSLKKGGKSLPLADGFTGTLTDNGGKIRFKSVGSYELTVAVTDNTGRSFTYTAPVTVYVVVGTLTGNSNIEPNGVTASLTVTVTPVTAVTPTFSDTLVVISSDSSATAAELGSAILPASGSIMVEGQSVAYTVDWNGGEALDRTAVGTEQTFTGTISYITPPAWLTLPDSSTVSRKVSVTAKQAVIIGGITTANKAYDGASYAPSGTATVTGGSVPVNQLEWLYESTDSAGYRNSTAPTNAGAYKLTISVPESNPDYAGSEIFNFTIAKREITLVTDNKTVTKGGSLPELTYTVGNLAPGETKADALSTQPVLACPTFDGNTVGSYPITLTGGTATDNYTITTRTNGTLTVAEQTYTVTFNLNGGSRTGGGELSQTIAEGGAATAPTVYRSGYTLTGWDKSFDNVTADLTVTASWSYNGGGGGGSSSDSSPIIITPPAADKPNSPTQGEIKVPGTVDKKGNITVNITDKTVTDAFNKALAETKKNGTEQNGITVVLRVDTGNNTDSNVTVNLPKAVQDTIIAKKIVSIIIVVDNPDIRVGIDLAAVQEINKQAKSDVNITATRMDSGKLIGDAKKAIGNRPVFDLKVNYGNGKAVSSFGAGSVSVTIPYTLGANEKAGNVQAVYVDSKGKVHWLVNSVYDSVEQVLRFSTNHFSTYGIGYKQTNTAFKDIAGHWAKGDIEFVASRGLFSGTSETKFSPNTAMTRGMFVTALGRLANADVSGYAKSSFSDVKGDAYYMGYIEWASKNSIVSGIGNGKFAPDQSITREQMAVIMSNYAKAIGYTLPKVHVENTFADNSKISTYAKEAVKQMQMAGVISGKNGNLFDPQGTATRAEVSAVLRRFVELAISSDTAQGWTMNDSGKWMYFKDGKPLTGKQDIDGATYTFDQYGVTADVPKNLRYTTYTVQKGDSFWSISRKLNCTMAEMERLNNKSRFALIHPGDVLRVPEK